jgi:hypothetical protein
VQRPVPESSRRFPRAVTWYIAPGNSIRIRRAIAFAAIAFPAGHKTPYINPVFKVFPARSKG